MPAIPFIAAGFLGGLWVRSELDSPMGDTLKWAAVAVIAYAAFRRFGR